ncbi:FBD domain-containing protein [Heracleum sosnowskyi]|uniref:FBD domain-containing protein n=1 Tax=Heracleum sosnowskyi TaxID=360622 RepID=A0AAD8MS65_9APIA|nr:FBD domain-containing protein [Heracleum sosnowskyi]
MKEILVVLRLILSSPNLQELHISSSSNAIAASEASDLNFRETDCPTGCTLKRLKTVKISDLSGVPHEMEFLKFLLKNSPVFEVMSILPGIYVSCGKLHVVIELLRFRRASAKAEIIFIRDQM